MAPEVSGPDHGEGGLPTFKQGQQCLRHGGVAPVEERVLKQRRILQGGHIFDARRKEGLRIAGVPERQQLAEQFRRSPLILEGLG